MTETSNIQSSCNLEFDETLSNIRFQIIASYKIIKVLVLVIIFH